MIHESTIKTSYPRIMIAGTSSGVGKTTITLAIAAAFRARGLNVQMFKVGPDFLDPTYHGIVSGKPCYNLDGWMMNGKHYILRLFWEAADQADISIIEGVMGFFDGSDPVDNSGSSAEIAEWLDCPILLVINTHGIARSVAAMVKGYAEFSDRINIAGVIANYCGSHRHSEWLNESLMGFGLPPLIAALPRGAFPTLPSRHLGLITATDTNITEDTLQTFGATFEKFGQVDAILKIANQAGRLQSVEPVVTAVPQSKLRLGYAFDEAFHFYYQDNFDAFRSRGFELIPFSPIHDKSLPADLDCLYFGGGYPELHAAELSENLGMLNSIRDLAKSGAFIYVECGGLMYISRGIETTNGEFYPMTGLLPAGTRMLEKRKMLGYVEAKCLADSFFGPKDAVLRGHEFHYSELLDNPLDDQDWKSVYSLQYRRSKKAIPEGYQRGNILASYVHVHFASKPEAINHFADVIRKSKQRGING